MGKKPSLDSMVGQKSSDSTTANERRDTSVYLALLLLLLGAVIMFRPTDSPEPKAASMPGSQPTIENKIDEKLKAAQVARDLIVLKAKIKELKEAQALRASGAGGAISSPGLSLKQESHGEGVIKETQDLDPVDLPRSENTLSDIVERRIARDKYLEDYDKKYEREYIRAFLENARSQGYEVELSEDLEVLNIREVGPRPTSRGPSSVNQ